MCILWDGHSVFSSVESSCLTFEPSDLKDTLMVSSCQLLYSNLLLLLSHVDPAEAACVPSTAPLRSLRNQAVMFLCQLCAVKLLWWTGSCSRVIMDQLTVSSSAELFWSDLVELQCSWSLLVIMGWTETLCQCSTAASSRLSLSHISVESNCVSVKKTSIKHFDLCELNKCDRCRLCVHLFITIQDENINNVLSVES